MVIQDGNQNRIITKRVFCFDDSKKNDKFEEKWIMEKKGIIKLGYVVNLRKSDNRPDCFSVLSKIAGRDISRKEIDDYIESAEFKVLYYDENNSLSEQSTAFSFRFEIPIKSMKGETIYGVFSRRSIETPYSGVWWEKTVTSLGIISPNAFDYIRNLTGDFSISEKTLEQFVTGRTTYFNGAGYSQFEDGTMVDGLSGKFARFETRFRTPSEETIYGWFTKNIRGSFEGIDWGTEKDFQMMIKKNRERFFVGRMIFDSLDSCNGFLKQLKVKTIEEPWEYKNRKDERFSFPILKSYLEFELERLFYEQEELKRTDRILYNNVKNKALFNTNLIDKFGHDLIIVGDLIIIGGKEYIGNLQIGPSKLSIKRMGFNSSEPVPPEFFKDINEIVFHCEWEIDSNLEKYEHIIEERIDRFPAKYKDMGSDELGAKLDNAITLARKIAQRNYKFIVPMYYPTAKRIQLLMPIYMESAYSSNPDFALVLTPHTREHLYTPETILGLDEVYQDARLIAKPEESWLNPMIIR